uniref:Uncharacterized protein n=1 Tax=Romanomermis culicivorax TaxID=13658 RepID=A0A915K3T1_ROMCU
MYIKTVEIITIDFSKSRLAEDYFQCVPSRTLKSKKIFRRYAPELPTFGSQIKYLVPFYVLYYLKTTLFERKKSVKKRETLDSWWETLVRA